jgi:hypothetical protein
LPVSPCSPCGSARRKSHVAKHLIDDNDTVYVLLFIEISNTFLIRDGGKFKFDNVVCCIYQIKIDSI